MNGSEKGSYVLSDGTMKRVYILVAENPTLSWTGEKGVANHGST